MQSFFSKTELNNLTMKGRESFVSSRKAKKEEEEPKTETVSTELSFPPSWEVSGEEKEAFQKLHEQCDPMTSGQAAISGIHMKKTEAGDYAFLVFIRHTMEKKLKMNEVTLSIFDEQDEVLGRKTFQLEDFGEVPPNGSRPWEFLFSEKDLFTEKIPEEGWKLVFQLSPVSKTHSLELTKSWRKRLPQEQQRRLRKMVEKVGPPRPGQVNFLGLSAKMVKEREELHISLLIRNGGEKTINLEKLPLVVEDASGEVIANGIFTLDPKLQVKAHTSTPWNFVFPKSMIKKSEPDLSKWRAYPPKKKKNQ
jgi:accessory Sec system S-layer assembly protein